MASRRIEDLHPDLQPLARKFLEECMAEGIDVLIYMTYRSNEEQDGLYAQGRTKPGNIVTNARGGHSSHNCVDPDGKPAAKAFDAVPRRGKELVWSDPALWNVMGCIANDVGLKWGGNWESFVDKPHFYIR